MTRPLTVFIATTLALGVGGCAAAPGPGGESRVDHRSRDAELFRVAVLEMTEQFGATLRVDPRPVRILGGVGESMQYHAPSDAARERLAVLEDLGVDTATALPRRVDCDAMFAPPDRKTVTGCPAELETILVVDTVMATPDPGQWLMRVKATFYDDYGRSALILNLILGRQDGEYVLIERVERLRLH